MYKAGCQLRPAQNHSNYCRVEENPQQKYIAQGRTSARASLRYSMAGCQQQPARNSSSCQQEDSPQHRQITHSCCMVNNNYFSPQFFCIVETAEVIKLGTLPSANMLAGVARVSSGGLVTPTVGSLSTTGTSAAVTTPLMSVASIMTPDNQSHPSGANYGSGANGTVVADPGIPAIKKWLAESILTGECIDLTELLPAKVGARTCQAP